MNDGRKRGRNSIPWQRAVAFAKLADGATLEFDCPAGQSEKAIHRIRVELSKMRAMVKERGFTIKQFKMVVAEVVLKVDDIRFETVRLQRVVGKNDMSEEVEAIFEAVALGKKIEAA